MSVRHECIANMKLTQIAHLRKNIGVMSLHTSNEFTINPECFAPILSKTDCEGPKEGFLEKLSNSHPFRPIDTMRLIVQMISKLYAKIGIFERFALELT